MEPVLLRKRSYYHNDSFKTNDEHDYINEEISLYLIPPKFQINLEEVENCVQARLDLLRKIDRIILERSDRVSSLVRSAYKEYLIKNRDSSSQKFRDHRSTINQLREQYASHFLLRLAYCKIHDKKRWFINLEGELLRYRLEDAKNETIQKLLQQSRLDYQEVSFEEISSIVKDEGQTRYKKIRFEQVLDLVKNRSVPLINGWAYVKLDQVKPVIIEMFKNMLHQECAKLAREYKNIDESDRLVPILTKIISFDKAEVYDYKNITFEKVYLGNLDKICDQSFPLCMRNLHNNMKTTHHLKYQGRIQYGLFIKGIGLSLEDSLEFWRREFTKVIDNTKFDKLYAYNIRYNYGQEGKRADFNPRSCLKIINSNPPGVGECHGCPYRHFDEKNLTSLLTKCNLPASSITEIVELSSKQHFQIACSKFFETVHPGVTNSITINHPNEYFNESRQVIEKSIV